MYWLLSEMSYASMTRWRKDATGKNMGCPKNQNNGKFSPGYLTRVSVPRCRRGWGALYTAMVSVDELWVCIYLSGLSSPDRNSHPAGCVSMQAATSGSREPLAATAIAVTADE